MKEPIARYERTRYLSVAAIHLLTIVALWGQWHRLAILVVTKRADQRGHSRCVYHASRFAIVTRKNGFSFSAGSILKSCEVFFGS